MNPNTCNPEISTQCAEEQLELQELQTPAAPPPLFKEPTPASPATFGIRPPDSPPQTGGQAGTFDAPVTEQPSELSTGGTPPLRFGGGGPALADCMSIWDSTTDMSKSEWKATCVRTLNGIDLPTEGMADTGARSATQAGRARATAGDAGK